MAFSSRRRNYMLVSHRRDQFIEFIKSLLRHSFVLDALAESALNSWRHIEELIEEHRARTDGSSRLAQAVPSIGSFFTRLPLARAWRRFDRRYRVSSRRFVSPSFNEIREILNSAQVLAFEKLHEGGDPVRRRRRQHRARGGADEDDDSDLSSSEDEDTENAATTLSKNGNSSSVEVPTPTTTTTTTTSTTKKNYSNLSFVSFDGDCTLYSDGKNFGDVEIAAQIKRLLQAGIRVALVTAAGYGYDAKKYERRLESLIRYLEKERVDGDTLRRFFVVGGESNYLLQLDYNEDDNTVACLVPRADVWERVVKFDDDAVDALLDVAEASINESVRDLNLVGARVLRKPRAVGLLPPLPARRELLDEVVLRAQDALRKARGLANNVSQTKAQMIPYCAFNGGSDVWCDIGNKKVGVQGLQHLFDLRPDTCLHIGDQFLNTGNDYAARSISCCIWITNPEETKRVLFDLLDVVERPAVASSEGEHHDEDDGGYYYYSRAENNNDDPGVLSNKNPDRPGSPTVKADGQPRIFRARTSSDTGILDYPGGVSP